MNEENINYLIKSAENEVRNNILSYWANNMVDNEFGGFYGERDFYGKLKPNASKGAVLNSRILWAFSKAYNVFKDEKYLNLATRAYNYIEKYFRDPEYDGIFWELDYLGKVVNTQKYCYTQGFWMYGLVEYYLASKNEDALNTALKIFHLLQDKAYDKRYEGYIEAFGRNWTLTGDVRISEKDLNENKTYNTHLHLLEPFTTLYQATKDKEVHDALENIVKLMFERFYIPSTGHFHLFFDDYWNFKGDLISYGHDIEGSWLLWEALLALENEDLKSKYLKYIIEIADFSAKESIDNDGGQFYEGNPNGPVDTDKHWWPQAEAVIGFLNAWKLTGDNKFFDFALNSWKFIENYIIDKQAGEWHWKVNRLGKPDTTQVKAGFWKCPYHNSRVCFEIMKRLS
jgi:mannobiose 2-epimerase